MFAVMVVEDDAVTRRLTCQVLRRGGYDPIPASDAAEALELMDRHHVDLFLLDVMMPGMDGFEFIRAVRGSRYETPILMTTAKGSLSDKREDTMLGGFSMGGYGALYNGLKYADTFGTVIAFSAALILESVQNRTSDGPAANDGYMKAMFGDLQHLVGSDLDPLHLAEVRKASGKPMPKLYLSCGEQDGLLDANIRFKDGLTRLGVDYTFRTTPGGHDWDFWEQEIRHVILDWME